MLNFQFQSRSLTFSFLISHFLFLIFFTSCSIERQIAKSAQADVLDTKALQTAHIGISIFDPAANKYLYNYQGDKYFVPASNIKLPTCYAAMKYLGDSLVGLRYFYSETNLAKELVVVVKPTGDPTFLHDDFKTQPVLNFLTQQSKSKYQIAFLDEDWQSDMYGSGWSWNDFNKSYLAERSSMPIYGNVITINLNEPSKRNINDSEISISDKVYMFSTQTPYFDTLVNWNARSLSNQVLKSYEPKIEIRRSFYSNSFGIRQSNRKFTQTFIPFVTHGSQTAQSILYNDLHIKHGILLKESNQFGGVEYIFYYPEYLKRKIKMNNWNVIHSQPTDSLLKPMMHRSDNFFAEQSLLMVSNEMLGVMNDEKIIDTLLKTDFKDLPQKPRWVDGSGLSRYNLFTPQDFVAILNKMKNEFGMERIKVILPTGGEGTISSYYKADSGYIYGKTGTLSGVVTFSGFLYTKKGKLLIFSTLVNNHQASATEVRKAVEKFLQGIRNNY